MDEDEEEEGAGEGDILGDLAYVVANPDSFDKDMMIAVIKAAIAEIIDLRIQLGSRGPIA